jgi:hypothetical protein
MNLKETFTEFNKQKPTIKFTIQKKLHNSINFIDLLIHRRVKKLEFAIYRKLTQTDTMIPNDSGYPHGHEYQVSTNW